MVTVPRTRVRAASARHWRPIGRQFALSMCVIVEQFIGQGRSPDSCGIVMRQFNSNVILGNYGQDCYSIAFNTAAVKHAELALTGMYWRVQY